MTALYACPARKNPGTRRRINGGYLAVLVGLHHRELVVRRVQLKTGLIAAGHASAVISALAETAMPSKIRYVNVFMKFFWH